jgi:hypothetical protein
MSVSRLHRQLAVVLLLATCLSTVASPHVARAEAQEPLHVPYGVGEKIEYDVKFGRWRVGSASMEVVATESVRGRDTWHTVFQVRAGNPIYRVNDQFDSWIERATGNSLRFTQNLNEGRRDVERKFEIYPERSLFIEEGDTLEKSVRNPLDDGSFLYFLRTIPLIVGETYSFERYFRPDRNPVTIRVLRRERVSVPAGDFDAIVVQPIIKTRGIFSEDGHAEVWLSDDPSRIMLQMKSGLSFGSINLYLTSFRPKGRYIGPAAR